MTGARSIATGERLLGISSETARARLARQGPNELPRSRTRSLLASAAHALAEGRRLLGAKPFALAMLEGGVALLFTLSVYATATLLETPEARTRLLSFTAIVIANLSLILFARSGGRSLWRHVTASNRSLWTVVIATVAGYAIIVAIAPLRELFRMSAPVPSDAAILAIATCIFWVALAVLGLAHETLADRRSNTATSR